jgi:PTH1 family peptidyl-tRNA hydrolase
MGIGRPQPRIEPADYVLGKFKQEEKDIVDRIIKTAGEVVLTILCKGTEESMNKFNQKQQKNQ